jgi:hypothetical protein
MQVLQTAFWVTIVGLILSSCDRSPEAHHESTDTLIKTIVSVYGLDSTVHHFSYDTKGDVGHVRTDKWTYPFAAPYQTIEVDIKRDNSARVIRLDYNYQGQISGWPIYFSFRYPTSGLYPFEQSYYSMDPTRTIWQLVDSSHVYFSGGKMIVHKNPSQTQQTKYEYYYNASGNIDSIVTYEGFDYYPSQVIFNRNNVTSYTYDNRRSSGLQLVLPHFEGLAVGKNNIATETTTYSPYPSFVTQHFLKYNSEGRVISDSTASGVYPSRRNFYYYE